MMAGSSDTGTDVAQKAPARTKSGMPAWRWLLAHHWPLWAALAVGAFLRLWLLDKASFLGDQVGLFGLARAGIVRHALPVASIPFSIGPLSPPFTTYLQVPFAALGNNPFLALLSVALWNILGIALCYVFALRYFGRTVAAVAVLLLATSGVAVNYSRLIWQVGYLVPLLTLWALTLYAGCVRGRPRWLVANVALLAMAVLLHPVAASLALVTLAGILLAPRRPRLWEYLVSALIVGVLALPTVLWEVATHGADIPTVLSYAHQPSEISLTFLNKLFLALGAPSATDFGPGSLYAAFGGWYPLINVLAVLIFAAGYLVLTWRIFLPARTFWRAETSPRWQDALRGWGLAVWRGLRQDPVWRGDLLLWLWVTLPCVFMLRHNSPPEVHYFMALMPALFIISGFALRWVVEYASGQHAGGASAFPWNRPRLVVAAATALLALLIVAQGVQSALYPTAIVSPGFDALHFYGYPLSELQAADARLSVLHREQGAATILISENTATRFQSQLHYLLVGEHADRSGVNDDCLILPAADSAPELVVATDASSYAAVLLPQLGNAQHVADVSMPGSAPFAVYRVAGAPPALAGEAATTPVEFRDASGSGLRLDAAAQVAPGVLRLRWTVLAATPAGQAPYIYQTALSDPSGAGGAGSAATAPAPVECRPASWQAGETIFTWQSLTPPTVPGQAPSTTDIPPQMVVRVNQGTGGLAMPTLGGLRLIAWQDQESFARLLPAQVGGTSTTAAPGTFTAQGEYTLPTSLSLGTSP